MALLDECAELLHQLRDARGVVGLAFDDQLVALGPDADVQKRFEVAQVFVVGPEERLDARLGDGNLAQWSGWNARISLLDEQT